MKELAIINEQLAIEASDTLGGALAPGEWGALRRRLVQRPAEKSPFSPDRGSPLPHPNRVSGSILIAVGFNPQNTKQ